MVELCAKKFVVYSVRGDGEVQRRYAGAAWQ